MGLIQYLAQSLPRAVAKVAAAAVTGRGTVAVAAVAAMMAVDLARGLLVKVITEALDQLPLRLVHRLVVVVHRKSVQTLPAGVSLVRAVMELHLA
jgi:hypothetical protein